MYQWLSSIVLCATLVCGVCADGFAQSYLVNSPFSRFGIGNIQPTEFSTNQGMGRVSAAYRSISSINYTNPASYSAIKLTTFETGIFGNGLWTSDGTLSNKSGTGALAYISFAFPITRYWGASVGLLPYANANYNVLQFGENEDFGTENFRFVGEGQWSQFYIGHGFRLKDFSVGFNAAYVLGNIERSTLSYFPDIEGAFGTRRRESLSVGDFTINGGVQYQLKLGAEDDKGFKKYHLTLGLSSDFPISLGVEREVEWARGPITETSINILDTVSIVSTMGDVKMPLRLRSGIALSKPGSWTLETDVAFEKWEAFEMMGSPSAVYTNAMNAAIGFEYTPFKRGAINNYFQSSMYRFGAYYNTGKLVINENKLSEFGVTFGMGLPIRKINSRLNFSFEVGQRGSISKNLIRETFFNATFGFTLNDIWFTKRKFD